MHGREVARNTPRVELHGGSLKSHSVDEVMEGHRDGLCPLCQGEVRVVESLDNRFGVWIELHDGEVFDAVEIAASSPEEALELALPDVLADFDRQTEYERWMIIGADALRRRLLAGDFSRRRPPAGGLDDA